MNDRHRYLRENAVDEGLPQDWGEPQEMPEVSDYLGPAPWHFGSWRFVVVELTADERMALTKMAHEQRRDTDAMAASLIRQALNRKKPEPKPERDREVELDELCERLRRSYAQR